MRSRERSPKPHCRDPRRPRGGKSNGSMPALCSAFHALLPLMFVPYFFSWYGLLWLPVGNYLFCSMGIGAGYHRLLTHRGYECPRWLEYTLAILGHCCIQDTPARWVAIHRMHHNNSDEQPDPHSPLVTLFWGHMGWLFVENSEFGKLATFEKFTKRSDAAAVLSLARTGLQRSVGHLGTCAVHHRPWGALRSTSLWRDRRHHPRAPRSGSSGAS